MSWRPEGVPEGLEIDEYIEQLRDLYRVRRQLAIVDDDARWGWLELGPKGMRITEDDPEGEDR